jgi:hypothetical protein
VRWFGQHREDETIARLLGDDFNRGDLWYVNGGANDPNVDSLTKCFYDRGACGISIEPVAFWWKKLVSERPRDINLHCALGDVEEERTIYVGAGTGLSTLVDGHDFGPYETYTERVQVRTLASICEEYPCPPDRWFAFMALDLEGWELPAIRGADFDRFRPRVLVIEADHGYIEWERLIVSAGYKFVQSDTANRFFVSVR